MNKTGNLVSGFALFLSIIMLLTNAVAISVTVTPTSGSTTNIPPDRYCGQTVQTSFSVTNNGGGGIVCYYYNNEDASKHPLMSSCLGPSGQTGTYNVPLSVPTSGSKTTTVQLECYEFWSLFGGNQCQNSYATDYQSAVSKTTSCSNANGVGCSGNTFGPRNFYLSCAQLQFSVTPSQSSVSLYSGQSQTVPITVTNSMSSYPITCDQGVGTIAAGGTNSNYQVTITAPSTGSGTTTQTATVTCNWQGGTSSSKSATITVSYQSDPCTSALNDAKSAISDAQSTIADAQSKIQEANNLGADITSAQAALNQANSQLSSAQTSLSTAQTSCNSGDKTNGASQANSAKTSASSAKTYATDALNQAQQSITTFTQKKTDAQNIISDAYSAIGSANNIIKKADDVINNATQLNSELQLGLDTVKPKSDVNTARVKIGEANNYYSEAQTAFDQKNFDSAKSKATEAKTRANAAETLANNAYTDLNQKILTLGEAAKAILAASQEISKTDEILNKMQFVVRSVSKWGVGLTEASEITSTGQSSIDHAKDILVQSKNRLQSGLSSEAASKAIEARDVAANPTNRLSRIVTSMKTNIEDALDAAYGNMTVKVGSTEQIVTEASKTYGATANEVVAAQNALANAKSGLDEAKTHMSNAKASTDLTTLISEAESAFEKISLAETKLVESKTHSDAAKTGMLITVATGATVVAGAAGGGFLYWRKRKQQKGEHKHKVHEKHAVQKGKKFELPKIFGASKHKTEDKTSHDEQYCSKCGTKVHKGDMFCPKCGHKM